MNNPYLQKAIVAGVSAALAGVDTHDIFPRRSTSTQSSAPGSTRASAGISESMVANIWAARRAKNETGDASSAENTGGGKRSMVSLISDVWSARQGGRT